MFPSVWPGDILIVERIAARALAEGDIVLYERGSRLFAHRVVKNRELDGDIGMLTRGDAMLTPDPAVLPAEVLGRISLILRDGRCIEPKKSLTYFGRMSAALFMHSGIAARVIVGIHGMRRPLRALTI